MECSAMLKEPDAIYRSLLLSQLISTERQINAVARNVLRQRSIIEEMERAAQDATDARSQLRELKEMEAVRIAERERMREALRNCSFAGGGRASADRGV